MAAYTTHPVGHLCTMCGPVGVSVDRLCPSCGSCPHICRGCGPDRKPRVDPRVPTNAIDRRLGRVHVGTPDAEVTRMITDAIELALDGPEAAQWTPAIRSQTVRYALWRHHRNLAQYVAVMRGRP